MLGLEPGAVGSAVRAVEGVERGGEQDGTEHEVGLGMEDQWGQVARLLPVETIVDFVSQQGPGVLPVGRLLPVEAIVGGAGRIGSGRPVASAALVVSSPRAHDLADPGGVFGGSSLLPQH